MRRCCIPVLEVGTRLLARGKCAGVQAAPVEERHAFSYSLLLRKIVRCRTFGSVYPDLEYLRPYRRRRWRWEEGERKIRRSFRGDGKNLYRTRWLE